MCEHVCGSQESTSSVFLNCSPSYFQRQPGPLKLWLGTGWTSWPEPRPLPTSQDLQKQQVRLSTSLPGQDPKLYYKESWSL